MRCLHSALTPVSNNSGCNEKCQARRCFLLITVCIGGSQAIGMEVRGAWRRFPFDLSHCSRGGPQDSRLAGRHIHPLPCLLLVLGF